MKLILFGGAILTLMTVAEAALPSFVWFLPLGGSPIAQLGIVFGTAVALSALFELLRGKNDEN